MLSMPRIFSKGPMTLEHDELGCEGQLVFAPDQELSQIDWLPISGKQISHPKAALCLHVQLPTEACPSHLHAL